MKEFKVEHIVEAISEVECIIAKQKNDAGWAGRMDDGGASLLQEKLEIFETMWDGKSLAESRVPKFIKSILIGVERLYDPEYQKYLELKAKFEENN
jgi:hypothetical protein